MTFVAMDLTYLDCFVKIPCSNYILREFKFSD